MKPAPPQPCAQSADCSNDVKVGYVLKMYPRLSETFIVNEILAHERAGLDIEIISLRTPADSHFHEMLGRVQAPVRYLLNPRLRVSEFWDAVSKAVRQHDSLWHALREPAAIGPDELYQALLVADHVRSHNITHLHAHFATTASTVARLASKLTGVPYTFTAHAKDIFHESVTDEDLDLKMRDAEAVVTVSDFNVRFLRERLGQGASKVRRIYNGIDLSSLAFQPPEDRPPLILGVGRLIEKKGFGDLIAACGILASRGRDFACTIIGGGELSPELAAKIESLGLQDRVQLTGPRPQGDVIRAIRGAAVFAAPCVVGQDGNRDGLPTVLLEAMALGTPCVATNVTGIPEAVRNGETGLIVPQHDPTSLALAIERMLSDAELSARFAASARDLVEERFDIDRNTAEMRGLFRHEPPPLVASPDLVEAVS